MPKKPKVRKGKERAARRSERGDPNPSEWELGVYQRRMAGEMSVELAKEFDCTASHIKHVCDEVAAKLYPHTKASVDRTRQAHTTRYEHIYDRAMQQFEESCKDELLTEDGKRETINGEMAHESTKRRRQSGNPSFLATAMNALAKIEELWSLREHDTRDQDTLPAGGPRHEMMRAWIDQQNSKLSAYEEAITSTEAVVAAKA